MDVKQIYNLKNINETEVWKLPRSYSRSDDNPTEVAVPKARKLGSVSSIYTLVILLFNVSVF